MQDWTHAEHLKNRDRTKDHQSSRREEGYSGDLAAKTFQTFFFFVWWRQRRQGRTRQTNFVERIFRRLHLKLRDAYTTHPKLYY